MSVITTAPSSLGGQVAQRVAKGVIDTARARISGCVTLLEHLQRCDAWKDTGDRDEVNGFVVEVLRDAWNTFDIITSDDPS